MKKLFILLAPFLMAFSCGPNRSPVVSVPTVKPCVTGVIPPEPGTVNGTLTGNEGRDIGIIAGAEKEVRVWGRGLRAMLEACR